MYGYFRGWKKAGLWERMNQAAREVGFKNGRKPEPSASTASSMCENPGRQQTQHGIDVHKQTLGQKCPILVETMGLLLIVLARCASVQDGTGNYRLLHKRFETVKHSIYNRWHRPKLPWADAASLKKISLTERTFSL